MDNHVTIVEVGPRDGLQNETRIVPTIEKIMLVNALSQCGFGKIETTSFVSPKWVPQLADAAKVMDGISRREGTLYSALTPNLQGLKAAIQHRADEVAIFASASEAFSQKNINCSIAQSMARFAELAELAKAQNLPIRGYVSNMIACPYSGPVEPQQVAAVAAQLLAIGCHEISLGDTIGVGTPQTVEAVVSAVLEEAAIGQIAGHFHDTHNRALENIELCLSLGMRIFDSSINGIGGCPYAPGAKGNVATQAVYERVEELGFHTGIDPANLYRVAQLAQQITA